MRTLPQWVLSTRLLTRPNQAGLNLEPRCHRQYQGSAEAHVAPQRLGERIELSLLGVEKIRAREFYGKVVIDVVPKTGRQI